MESAAFLDAALQNRFNREILRRLPELALPQGQLVAGCLFQTLWNVRSGQAPEAQIKDYDVFYFDDRDLSYEAEDEVIRAAEALFADLPVDVEVRNQARVHLWYEAHFGLPCPPLASAREGIDRFLILATCLGVQPFADGTCTLYAPHGCADTALGLLRPNPRHDTPHLFEAKAQSYRRRWPWLRVAREEPQKLPKASPGQS